MCNVASSIEARVADLVARIPVPDRPPQLVDAVPPIDPLWIPPQNWWNEALHGLLHPPAVAFPSAISSAASMNRSLFFEIGSAVGTEARVVDNLGISRGHTFWAPNVNLFRDPRWGRGQETPGEDPTVNAAYGSNFVGGFQGSTSTLPPGEGIKLKASACDKHFFGYSLENCFAAKDNCRMNFNANITQQEIEDTYLPAFEAAVKVGKVSGLMCSENAVNGVPACANAWAMTTVARDSWGGDFYVTGDCGAVETALLPYPTSDAWPPIGAAGGKGHGYQLPPNASFESAGLDSDCTSHAGMRSKAVGTVADQGAALAHLFRTEFRLGRFDPLGASPFNSLGWKDIGTQAHQELAREACQQSIVLLKNENSTLPLSAGSARIRIAMIGPNWEVKEVRSLTLARP